MELVLDESRLVAHVSELRETIDRALNTLDIAQSPSELYDPVRYVLEGKGKRIRPILLLLSAQTFDVSIQEALPAALAVEVFHNFTLVHDDIMDHADTRRGRETVHVKWDVDTAILSGDYMMALSYELLGLVETPCMSALLASYARMVRRLCEGQALDKAFEDRLDVSVADYLEMIDGKTGALLHCVFELGGIIGNASDHQLQMLKSAGDHIGRAFQIQDDLLDLTADDARWGKTIGGDLLEGKKTMLLLRSLEIAAGAEHKWFRRILYENGLAADEIPEARDRMQRLGVLDEAQEAVVHHTQQALACIEKLPPGEAQMSLRWLISEMQVRAH